MNKIKTFAAATMAASVLLASPASAGTLNLDQCDGKDSTPPCANEDTGAFPRCVWDGRHMGEGHGKSFILHFATDGGPTTVQYIKHRRAHHLAKTCA